MADARLIDSAKVQDFINRIDAKKAALLDAIVVSETANKAVDKLTGEMLTLRKQFADFIEPYL